MKRILVTGGAGFIGSNLAVALSLNNDVVCFDNLSRRGSEILLDRIMQSGCSFIHGDIRNQEDFAKIKGSFDVLIECSAEPSVLAGINGEDARYLINNNLGGSINCFEFARTRSIPVIFLSTSRVYPHAAINRLAFREGDSRFEYADNKTGVSERGIAVDFPLQGPRSLYGATKLASELLLQEYCAQYDLPALINRCGVIAGPWQLGKADQGIFTFWLYKHYYSQPVSYIGFGGTGKQVRDLLHIEDLVRLLKKQIDSVGSFRGEVFNAGGSIYSNLSLCETTELCRTITGNTVEIGSVPHDRPADVKWFITDNGSTESVFDWKPEKKPVDILHDTFAWLETGGKRFSHLFGGNK